VTRQGGFSVVEVLVAALLIAGALVPLMQLYPGTLRAEIVDDTSMRLGTAAVRQMEAVITSLRHNITGASSGSQACPDVQGCLVEWTVTTEASSGTQGVGQLVDVTVTTCVDANQNGVCDPGETQVRNDAKVTSRP